jgi:TPP-dependent pyruvate/acetoin dehydrogenase alpha subunit
VQFQLREQMDQAVAFAVQAPYPDPNEVIEDVYA